ncbi:hypothetical protein LTR70_004718 [Exophiala xenobiotica]|uniref:Protein kinase domain-containing protein n=1 Tax=Lithohypha guttulata TaxID=1690604 RepID=A0ABR0KCJ3_9EURO|nr:hypothetical protein LTR24_004334 [Lithohypha guttulata]KAK5319932.1 hypothetical protein LTR70_004718 [Exophiala xenobiotica]
MENEGPEVVPPESEIFPPTVRCTVIVAFSDDKTEEPREFDLCWTGRKDYETMDHWLRSKLKKYEVSQGSRKVYFRHGSFRAFGPDHTIDIFDIKESRLQEDFVNYVRDHIVRGACGFIYRYPRDPFKFQIDLNYSSVNLQFGMNKSLIFEIEKKLKDNINIDGRKFISRADLGPFHDKNIIQRIIELDHDVKCGKLRKSPARGMSSTMMTFSRSNAFGFVHRDKNQLGRGMYGNVRAVRIDPAHHQFSQDISRDRNCVFALKEFTKTGASDEFKTEIKMLRKLEKIPHKHLLQNLASWVYQKRFFILYPKADFNLRTFMEDHDLYPAQEGRRQAGHGIWLIDQLRGLADALRKIHSMGRETTAQSHEGTSSTGFAQASIYSGEKTGCHHDLKPENILVFGDGIPNFVFKIADYGCANAKDLDAEGNSRKTHAKGTQDYHAPEASSDSVSRPFDMWAMGCIFLELLVWGFMPSKSKKEAFVNERKQCMDKIPSSTVHDHGFYYRENSLGQRVKLRPAVIEHIAALRKHCKGDPAFEEIVNPGKVIEQLLCINKDDRMKAPRLFEAMDAIHTNAIADTKPKAAGESRKVVEPFPQPSDAGDVQPPEQAYSLTVIPPDVHPEPQEDHANSGAGFAENSFGPAPAPTSQPRRSAKQALQNVDKHFSPKK